MQRAAIKKHKSKLRTGGKKYVKPDELKTPQDYTTAALSDAEDLWNKIKETVKSTPDFVNMTDEDKMSLFISDKEFLNNFPIVSKYMICMGQYNDVAFRRYLDASSKMTKDVPADRQKGYMEDQWVKRQADYIKFLWEAYNKGASKRDANAIWSQAYDTLKSEFIQFKDDYEEKENSFKELKKQQNAERIKELIQQIQDGHELSTENKKVLMTLLIEQKEKQDARTHAPELDSDSKSTSMSPAAE
jgi:hypothetical protein